MAVGVAGTQLGFELRARRVQDHVLQQTVEPGPVVGVNARMQFVERRHRAFRVQPQHGHPALVHRKPAGRCVPVPLTEVGAAQRQVELLDALAHLLLKGEPTCQVACQQRRQEADHGRSDEPQRPGNQGKAAPGRQQCAGVQPHQYAQLGLCGQVAKREKPLHAVQRACLLETASRRAGQRRLEQRQVGQLLSHRSRVERAAHQDRAVAAQ